MKNILLFFVLLFELAAYGQTGPLQPNPWTTTTNAALVNYPAGITNANIIAATNFESMGVINMQNSSTGANAGQAYVDLFNSAFLTSLSGAIRISGTNFGIAQSGAFSFKGIASGNGAGLTNCSATNITGAALNTVSNIFSGISGGIVLNPFTTNTLAITNLYTISTTTNYVLASGFGTAEINSPFYWYNTGGEYTNTSGDVLDFSGGMWGFNCNCGSCMGAQSYTNISPTSLTGNYNTNGGGCANAPGGLVALGTMTNYVYYPIYNPSNYATVSFSQSTTNTIGVGQISGVFGLGSLPSSILTNPPSPSAAKVITYNGSTYVWSNVPSGGSLPSFALTNGQTTAISLSNQNNSIGATNVTFGDGTVQSTAGVSAAVAQTYTNAIGAGQISGVLAVANVPNQVNYLTNNQTTIVTLNSNVVLTGNSITLTITNTGTSFILTTSGGGNRPLTINTNGLYSFANVIFTNSTVVASNIQGQVGNGNGSIVMNDSSLSLDAGGGQLSIKVALNGDNQSYRNLNGEGLEAHNFLQYYATNAGSASLLASNYVATANIITTRSNSLPSVAITTTGYTNLTGGNVVAYVTGTAATLTKNTVSLFGSFTGPATVMLKTNEWFNTTGTVTINVEPF